MPLYLPLITQALELPGLGMGAAPVWVTPRDVRPDAEGPLERTMPESAEFLVPGWLRDLEIIEALEKMLESESFIGCPPYVSAAERIDRLVAAFVEERLWLWQRPVFGVDRPAVFPEVEGDRPAVRTSWIRISLHDEDGAPVQHERYDITDADGRSFVGQLDSEGYKEIGGLASGLCEVSFPDIDWREWGRTLPSLGGPNPNEQPPHAHIVSENEDVHIIAARHGFRHWGTVWLNDANAELRRFRSPNLLFPGDSVSIPGRTQRHEDAIVERLHLFKARLSTRRLLLRLEEIEGRPLRDRSCTVYVDGRLAAADHAIDASEHLDLVIPQGARAVELRTTRVVYQLALGGLNPLHEAPDNGVSGAQQRLNNLGYAAGPEDGTLGPRTSSAIRRFQAANALSITGLLDERTLTSLARIHGA